MGCRGEDEEVSRDSKADRWPPFYDFLSLNFDNMSKKIINSQQILAGEIKMDSLTRFHMNGDVNIYPCSWVDEQVTTGGTRRPKGRMTIEEDGTSHFHAYRTDSGSRYTHLFMTENAEVKRTRKQLIVKFVLPLGIGRFAIIEALTRQMQEIVNYVRSLKENTCWV